MKYIPTDTEQLIVKEDPNNVITIILNNPQHMNALSEELTPYLRKTFKNINKDNKHKLLIIRGAGKAFCSGGNIKKMLVKKSVKVNKSFAEKELLKN